MPRQTSIGLVRKLQHTLKRTFKRLWLRAWLVWMAIGPSPHEHTPQRLAR